MVGPRSTQAIIPGNHPATRRQDMVPVQKPPRGLREPIPSYLAQLPAAERSRMQRAPRMDPYLQFMVGPLLRYDTVDENGLWNGAVLIVTADWGSSYEPHPILTYQWDPEERAQPRVGQNTGSSFDLGPHPADPHSTAISPPAFTRGSEGWDYRSKSDAIGDQTQRVTGQEIYVYAGNGGTFTFWRFPIQIQLGSAELCIKYSINNSVQLFFYVPAINQNMRWATYSCNGFSAGVNQEEFRGPGYKNGYDPMWFDLLREHAREPFHVLVGGGDQLYCDSLTREPEMQDWVHQTNPSIKSTYPVSPEMSACMDRFLFNHYCACFRNGAFARANSSIPMLNMCGKCLNIQRDYPDELQSSPVFLAIGARAYFFYLLFQCFINPYVDGLDDRRGAHPFKSLILGVRGPYVGLPSHSHLAYMGPSSKDFDAGLAERMKDRVCSDEEYRRVMEAISRMPPQVEHLVIQLGIPIAYPRMVFLENALDFKSNPLTAIARSGQALNGFVNKFNGEPELLDDLNDHWTAKPHKKERNWFIQQLQGISRMKRVRITFLSGDVHCAAVGVLKTLSRQSGGKNSKVPDIPPAADYRYMVNVVTSAIVNTPCVASPLTRHPCDSFVRPPTAVIVMVSRLAAKTHKTLHHTETDEIMMPLFTHEPDGTLRERNKYIMGRRNWCAVWWEPTSGEMVFDIRVEREKGVGESVGYVCVQWSRQDFNVFADIKFEFPLPSSPITEHSAVRS
ncbi:hypothetical protein J3R83DRAFT_4684 [Lanmaoa asiatica]|nr:hypothetical protein J3R83DRAFT_4684 [Lanmaoa asiatica]